tara:strand:- start:112 stop:336 length:225 start_codon:yes stop_codon:yes gene_type:complete
MTKKTKELIITDYAKVIAQNIKTNKDGEVDNEDIIELAIQIGEDNGLYDSNDEENFYWNDLDRNRCYRKAYEII